MATKLKPRKRPAKAGPLRRLTAKERAAKDAMGVNYGPGIIPKPETLAVLKPYNIKSEAGGALIEACWEALGVYRIENGMLTDRLTPTELVEQARMTAAIAEELHQRMEFMAPEVSGIADPEATKVWGDRIFSESFKTDLIRLQVVLRGVAHDIDSTFDKTVTKRTAPRDRLLAHVDVKLAEIAPQLDDVRRRILGGNLLDCWGVPVPDDADELLKAIKRGKKALSGKMTQKV